MSSRIRAVVLGLGPAGRIAAHRAAARGWEVTAFDPAGGTMPSTVGAWAPQLPAWLPGDAVASRFRPAVITSDGRRRVLDDDYVVLDTAVLGGLGGFGIRREKAEAGSATDLRGVGLSGDGVGRGEPASADVVVDATGAAPGISPLAARQLALGHVFDETALPENVRTPVLMDFTVPPAGPGESGMAEPRPATFSYRLPLGGGKWLIEETILAARASAAPDDRRRERLHRHLRDAQARRLASLGVDPGAALSEEIVDFPLGPSALPDNRLDPGDRMRDDRGRVVCFGAGGGWMHPATGYSVGSVLADVDRFLDRLESRSDALPPGGRPLAWLRRRGLHVLLGFDPHQTREFFDAFFTLPDPAIREFLTGASAPKTMAVMFRLALPLARKNPATLVKLLAVFADGKSVAPH